MHGAGASRTLLPLRSKAGRGPPRRLAVGTRGWRDRDAAAAAPWVPAEGGREAGVPGFGGLGGASFGAGLSAVTKGDVSSTRWVPALSPPQQGAGTMSGGSPGTGWLSHPRSLAAAGGARLPLGSRSLSPSPLSPTSPVSLPPPPGFPCPSCAGGADPDPVPQCLRLAQRDWGYVRRRGQLLPPLPPLYLVRMYQSVAQYVVLNLPIH